VATHGALGLCRNHLRGTSHGRARGVIDRERRFIQAALLEPRTGGVYGHGPTVRPAHASSCRSPATLDLVSKSAGFKTERFASCGFYPSQTESKEFLSCALRARSDDSEIAGYAQKRLDKWTAEVPDGKERGQVAVMNST